MTASLSMDVTFYSADPTDGDVPFRVSLTAEGLPKTKMVTLWTQFGPPDDVDADNPVGQFITTLPVVGGAFIPTPYFEDSLVIAGQHGEEWAFVTNVYDNPHGSIKGTPIAHADTTVTTP